MNWHITYDRYILHDLSDLFPMDIPRFIWIGQRYAEGILLHSKLENGTDISKLAPAHFRNLLAARYALRARGRL